MARLYPVFWEQKGAGTSCPGASGSVVAKRRLLPALEGTGAGAARHLQTRRAALWPEWQMMRPCKVGLQKEVALGGGGQESCSLSPPRTPCRLPDPEHTWRISRVVSPGRGAVPRTPMLVSPPRGTGRWARVSASDPSSKVWELPLQVRGGRVPPYTEPDPAFAPGLHVCP